MTTAGRSTDDMNSDPTGAAEIVQTTAGRQVSTAVAWTAGLRALTRSLAIVTTLALARLIAPAEYGVYTTIIIANQALQALTDIALNDAVVQRPGDIRGYLPTAWTATLVKGLAVYVLVFAVAPGFCAYFGVPEATDLLRVLGLVQIVMGFHSIGPTILRRELRFQKLFLLYASEAVTFSAVAIALGMVRHDAWALVIATLASFSVRVLVSHAISPVRVGIGFDVTKFRELFHFAKWVNANVFVDFVLETADNATVARLLGPSVLAFYRMAYQLATEGSGAVPWVLTTVAFPAFARIQFDPVHLRTSFRGLLGLVSAALMPVAVGLTMLGTPAVLLGLGESWAPAAAPLAILSVAAVFRAITETARPVLLGIGDSRADFILRFMQAIMLVLMLVPAGTAYGVTGAAAAVLGAAVLTLPLWVIVLTRRAHLRLSDMTLPVVAPLLAGGAAIAALVATAPVESNWESFGGHSAILLVVYGLATLLLHRILPRSGLAAARAAFT